MHWFEKFKVYWNHGRRKEVNGQLREATDLTQLASTLARELTDEMTELQAARDPLAALVRRVRSNQRE